MEDDEKLTDPPENDIPDESKLERPFQFSIRQLVILTAGVAVVCAAGRVMGVKSVWEQFALILDALFLLAFIKCFYAIPAVFQYYKGRNVIHFSIGILVCVYGSFFLVEPWGDFFPIDVIYNVLYPYAAITSRILDSLVSGFDHLLFTMSVTLLTLVSQFYIYGIILALAAKRKYLPVAIPGIVLLHIISAVVAFNID